MARSGMIRWRMGLRGLALSSLVLALGLSACNNNKSNAAALAGGSGHGSASSAVLTRAPEGTQPVNAFCVIMPDHPSSASETFMYQGQAIGFCCADCISSFEEADEATRAKMIADAKAKKASAGGASVIPAGQPINSVCPFSGKPAKADVVAMHEGSTIAFCCPGCQGSFAKKSEAEKDAILAKAASAR
ncbi:MAG: hypothetical protein SFZ23_09855 [Planctomycetota bacterium]|nr:hypothetical protein [Planctomycetota bacterium]